MLSESTFDNAELAENIAKEIDNAQLTMTNAASQDRMPNALPQISSSQDKQVRADLAATTLVLLTKAAEQGDAEAQYNLGKMHAEGKDVPQDYAKAFDFLSKAAEQGFSYAQFQLGDIYEGGRGVLKDCKKAYMWYGMAAACGYKQSQTARDRLEGNLTPRAMIEAEAEIARKQAETQKAKLKATDAALQGEMTSP